MTRFERPWRTCSQLLLLSCLAMACGHKSAPTTTPAPTPYLIPTPECDLPAFPEPAPVAVGFPDPENILLTRTDFSGLLQYVQGLRDWIEAAGACLRGQMSFANEVKSFMGQQ
jgi:hypothetical protein